ncbi:MAG: hypothetical protein Q9166_003093 [cf. Caloplaca sp. 2 TL-2023]
MQIQFRCEGEAHKVQVTQKANDDFQVDHGEDCDFPLAMKWTTFESIRLDILPVNLKSFEGISVGNVAQKMAHLRVLLARHLTLKDVPQSQAPVMDLTGVLGDALPEQPTPGLERTKESIRQELHALHQLHQQHQRERLDRYTAKATALQAEFDEKMRVLREENEKSTTAVEEDFRVRHRVLLTALDQCEEEEKEEEGVPAASLKDHGRLLDWW